MNSQSQPLTLARESDFPAILEKRKQLRATPSYQGKLKQGTRLPGLSLSPYSFSELFKYLKGMLWGDSASKNECQHQAPIGKKSRIHSVGVQQGTLKSEEKEFKSDNEDAKKIKIIFAGDLMVSESGHPIELGEALLNELENADAFVINVESPVNFKDSREGRKGLKFEMSQAYLASLVRHVYAKHDKIKIIYNIANNHALDGSDSQDPSLLSAEEKSLFEADRKNYILLRTMHAIRKADNKAIIIGAHCAPHTDDIAVIEKEGTRIGVLGFTDILNHNAHYWDRRVVRSEDIPDDLHQLKAKWKLDHLYLYGHGNLEQNIYPSPHWRNLAVQFLNNGADGFIGHGPHVPQTNEILKISNQDKLLVHSVGNFFGPKNLANTGLNLLAVLEFMKSTAKFAMKPIQAIVKDQTPQVDIADRNNTPYPNLQQRIDRLYPQAEYLNHTDDILSESTITEVMSILKKYENTWFRKSKDRVKNLETLRTKINQKSITKENLLTWVNQASEDAKQADKLANLHACFFKRNIMGSRYQETLEAVKLRMV